MPTYRIRGTISFDRNEGASGVVSYTDQTADWQADGADDQAALAGAMAACEAADWNGWTIDNILWSDGPYIFIFGNDQDGLNHWVPIP